MMSPTTSPRHLVRIALFATVSALVSACLGNDEVTDPGTGRPLFASYVAIGNSVTAGYQSGGINDSTQMESYAVMLAQQMGLTIGTDFIVPSLTGGGCPPPITNIFTQERLGGGSQTDCTPPTSGTPHNLAIPGAKVIDALSTTDSRANPNVFTTLFLGDQPQLTVAQSLEPTFVSVFLGNNDALGAALSGDPALLTSDAQFETDYLAVTQTIADMGVEGAVLIGVAPVTLVPNLSPGAAYWVGAQQGALPPTLTVAANCATAAAGGAGEATLVPFAYGFGLIGAATAGQSVTLDCLADAQVLTLTEIAQIIGAVARFNTIIEREANRRGWAYVDPAVLGDSLRAAGEVPLFPNTSGLDALLRPFGDFMSRDGFHPSGAFHRLFANHVIDAINATYPGANLSRVP